MKLFPQAVLPFFRNADSDGGLQSGLGYGCMGLTAFYGSALPDDESMKLLQAIYDAGCRHFDTAEVYQQNGKFNEDVLGLFFETVPRDSYTVATKYWPKDVEEVYEYDHIKAALIDSLKRLKLDYVDLYYAHRVKTLEGGIKFAAAAKRLKEEGLIKEVGLSEVSGKWLKRIHEEGGPIDAVQQEWSLITRSLETELVPVCKELGIPIVAYSPLARNMLAQKLDKPPEDWRANMPRYSPENLEANNKIVEQVQEMAAKYDATAAQLSLAWLFHKAQELGVSVIPIPGSTKMKHAMDNLGAVKIDISDDDCKVLEGLANQVAGERANESYMSMSIESQT